MIPPTATPMIQQYLAIKQGYPDAILFYRMGDFYEMFFEDAHRAAKVLEIALTSRNKNDADAVPMCGVPYRAAQSYIARLIDNGFKVAICDQMEDPGTAKGLVKREVVRVVTPGMIVENELLAPDSNNFLLSLTFAAQCFGIACADISTGQFRVTETADFGRILDEVQRIAPREILLPLQEESADWTSRVQAALTGVVVNWRETALFDSQRGYRRLIDQFQTRSLEGFGCEALKAGVGAAGALLHYVQETQKQAVSYLKSIETYSLEEHLVVDHQSRLNLELEKNLRGGSRQGTLIAILDKTITSMGGRRMKLWLRYPLLSPERIGRRLDAVEEAVVQSDIRRRIRQRLSSVGDLERLHSRIVLGHANGRDLLNLARSLAALPDIREALVDLRSELFCPDFAGDDLDALATMIESAIRDDAPPTINEGGMIRKGFNAELDELIQLSLDAKGRLARLEVEEKAASGINTLKVRYNKVFGYYIEVPKSQAQAVPPHYVRKQTLVNAERYITDELKQFEIRVMGAEEKRCALELSIFQSLREQVRESSAALMAAAAFVARLDCLLALAEAADLNDYCRPAINTVGVIRVEEGRHPVVEKSIGGERFVPNTIVLDNQEQQIMLITGPNMAGKSTVLRQTALSVILAQMGSFVPARSADIAVVDRIFTRVGALDNLSAGQSTFMVEMEETANILNHATGDSLVIMDEIGRGTSTYDGLSIAWAVVDYLHDLKGVGVKTLFATHYHELTELAQTKSRVRNFTIAVKEWNDQIIFLRQLVPGGTNRSYGIQVARLAGLPEAVIQKAKTILERVEAHAPAGSAASGRRSGAASDRVKPVQLDLFESSEDSIRRRLRGVDLNGTTPLEALNLLQELQAEAKRSIH